MVYCVRLESGFAARHHRFKSCTLRQLVKEEFGSPATRARQPIFGEISSRFEFSKAKSLPAFGGWAFLE